MRREQSRFKPYPKIVWNEVAFHGFLRLFEHREHQLFNVRTWFAEDNVVRHVVRILEFHHHAFAGRNNDLGLIEFHLSG